MKSPASLFSDFKTVMYKNYGENPGKMLVHTGVLGWIWSIDLIQPSEATNKNRKKKQKNKIVIKNK